MSSDQVPYSVKCFREIIDFIPEKFRQDAYRLLCKTVSLKYVPDEYIALRL